MLHISPKNQRVAPDIAERKKAMDRMTRKNPNGTYRLPMNTAQSIRTEWQMEMPVMFGAPIDRLGEYEEIGTPKEFAMLKAMYGTKK